MAETTAHPAVRCEPINLDLSSWVVSVLNRIKCISLYMNVNGAQGDKARVSLYVPASIQAVEVDGDDDNEVR